MINSMTGYGSAAWHDDSGALQVEIRTVNGKSLRTQAKLPDFLAPCEREIDKQVRAQFRRGSVDVIVRYEDAVAGSENITVNQDIAARYRQQLAELAASLGLEGQPGLDLLVSLPGVVGSAPKAEPADGQKLWPTLQGLVAEALERAAVARAEEGAALHADLIARANAARESLAAISQARPEAMARFRDRFRQRIEQLMQESGLAVAEDALCREIILSAERYDVSEEITRLGAHLDRLSETIEEPTPVGRKLEFLAQEMFREVNTMASKACDASLTDVILGLKEEIDKVREQAANVE